MNTVLAPEREAAETTSQCRHHWIIESPNGATSRGYCHLCGATKVFVNIFADAEWQVGAFPELDESPLAEMDRFYREENEAA